MDGRRGPAGSSGAVAAASSGRLASSDAFRWGSVGYFHHDDMKTNGGRQHQGVWSPNLLRLHIRIILSHLGKKYPERRRDFRTDPLLKQKCETSTLASLVGAHFRRHELVRRRLGCPLIGRTALWVEAFSRYERKTLEPLKPETDLTPRLRREWSLGSGPNLA